MRNLMIMAPAALLCCSAIGLYAQSPGEDASTYSSSASAMELPDPPSGVTKTGELVREYRAKPFHSVAVGPKIGVEGIGFDLATPLNGFLTLRGGAQFFDHAANVNADGLRSTGDLTLQNVQVSVDYFPFRHSSFHVSPGITVHNDNHLTSYINVPGGDVFTLGDTYYTSDPNAPIYGYSRFRLGNTVAPRITVGWGSMIPRRGGHISFPFEIGFQYISSPMLDLHLGGNACDNMGNCGDINANDGPDNIQSEIQQLNQEIAGLRFYPILSFGFAYKFGH